MKVSISVAVISLYIIIQLTGCVESKGNTTKQCRLYNYRRSMLRSGLLSPDIHQLFLEKQSNFNGSCPHAEEYRYTDRDTGDSTLGRYLARTLNKIGKPTYHDGISYNHYAVQHYYHNKDRMSANTTIEPPTFVPCKRDLRAFCPSKTDALCVNNGTALCVAGISSTVNCTLEKDKQCVQSSVSCSYHDNPRWCKRRGRHTGSIVIPCMTIVIMERNIYVNDIIDPPKNPDYFYSESEEDSPKDNLTRFCLAIRIDPTV